MKTEPICPPNKRIVWMNAENVRIRCGLDIPPEKVACRINVETKPMNKGLSHSHEQFGTVVVCGRPGAGDFGIQTFCETGHTLHLMVSSLDGHRSHLNRDRTAVYSTSGISKSFLVKNS